MSRRFAGLSVSLIAAGCFTRDVATHHEPSTPSSAFTANQPVTPAPTNAMPMTVTALNAPIGPWDELRKIAAITAVSSGWYTIELAPNGDPIPLQLQIGTAASVPFNVGDTIVVRGIRVELGATSFDIAIGLFDDRSALLAGSFTDRAALDGWVVTRVGVDPCAIGVGHGDARIVIPPGGWYTLRAADGVFAVSVDCARPPVVTPPGQPPPNDYFPDSNVVHIWRLRL